MIMMMATKLRLSGLLMMLKYWVATLLRLATEQGLNFWMQSDKRQTGQVCFTAEFLLKDNIENSRLGLFICIVCFACR